MFKRAPLLLLFVTLTSVSLMGVASSEYVPPKTVSTQVINQLDVALQGHVFDPTSRDQRLRVERAQHYLQKAKQMHGANWDKQASDYAQRGLNLIALNRR